MSAEESALTELVIVCGHATFMGDGDDILSEEQWLLQPFQRSDRSKHKPGEHETFIAHILSGAFTVAGRSNALLMFSGGRTSRSSRTEAEGYEQVYHGLGEPFDLGERYAREDYAADSFQNLLFSILRFRQVTGQYPRQVVVVTHAFKQTRFLELHAPAIKWPADRIRVSGINPPFTEDELRQTVRGEVESAHQRFVEDSYGQHYPLASKRQARNQDPAVVEEAYRDVEEEVLNLLRWDGGPDGRTLFPEKLPWEEESHD